VAAELSEKVNYLHAKSTYGMKDYTLAAYYLANFVRTFPTSQYAEECAFLSAYCQYMNSARTTSWTRPRHAQCHGPDAAVPGAVPESSAEGQLQRPHRWDAHQSWK
jgi:hypothetical protein